MSRLYFNGLGPGREPAFVVRRIKLRQSALRFGRAYKEQTNLNKKVELYILDSVLNSIGIKYFS